MPNTDKVISELAAKLGVSVEYLWRALLSQQRTEGIVYLILCFFFVGGAYVLNKRIALVLDDDNYDRTPRLFFQSLTLIVAFCFVSGFGYWALTDLTNPAYSALHDIVSMVGK